MRRLARLEGYMKDKVGPDTTLSTILAPQYFDNIVDFAMAEGNLTGEETKDSTPNAAKRLKEDVIEALELKESLASVNSDNEKDARKLYQVRLLFLLPIFLITIQI